MARFSRNEAPILLSRVAFTLRDSGLLPEDIDYDAGSHSFLVTSVLERKIIRVRTDRSAADFAFSPDHWPMVALKIDAARNRVWATEVAFNGFTAAPKSAWGRSAVLAFDLRSGRLLERIEAPACIPRLRWRGLVCTTSKQVRIPLFLQRPEGPSTRAKLELALVNSMHEFQPSQSDGCRPIGLEAQHGAASSLDRPMILLYDIVQVLGYWLLGSCLPERISTADPLDEVCADLHAPRRSIQSAPKAMNGRD